MSDVIQLLKEAERGGYTDATWCGRCARVVVSRRGPRGDRGKFTVLNEGRDTDCRQVIGSGSINDCLAALTASDGVSQGFALAGDGGKN